MNFTSVSEKDWIISVADGQRIDRLSASSTGRELIYHTALQSMQAANAGKVSLSWEQAIDAPSYWRTNAKIIIEEELFDQLFNSRSGYRAQYYLSMDAGENFNRALIDELVPAIQVAYPFSPIGDITWPAVKTSLEGRYSKIGVKNGDAYEPRGTLKTPRWGECNFGSCLLSALSAQIDLLGTFINPDDFLDDWIDELKKSRSIDMHTRGFS